MSVPDPPYAEEVQEPPEAYIVEDSLFGMTAGTSDSINRLRLENLKLRYELAKLRRKLEKAVRSG